MKNRTAFAFLAGFASCCAALYGTGNHTPAVFFAFGALAGCAAFMGFQSAFWRRERKTRVVHHRRRGTPRPRLVTTPAAPEPEAIDARRKCEPGTFKKPVSQIEADVASALKNFGASKAQAAELARDAFTSAGTGANFQAVMRLALRRRTAA